MDLTMGLVVRARSGRDKNKFFVVIDCDKEYAYIVDGKSRRLDKPKKKNIKHIAFTNTVISPELLGTNKSIKTQLKEFGV